MRPTGTSKAPPLAAGELYTDPFCSNPAVWGSANAQQVIKVLKNTTDIVKNMSDEVFVAAWSRVAAVGDSVVAKIEDDVLVAMAVRAYSNNLVAATSFLEDDAFWQQTTPKPLTQKKISSKVTLRLACFMGEEDFRRMMGVISESSLKNLANSVKKVVIVRCGDSFDATANGTTLGEDAIKSRTKFLASK